jgi:TusA-related sulfurtransferase
MKKPLTIIIGHSKTSGVPRSLEQEAKDYYAGSIQIQGIPFHIEAIRAKREIKNGATIRIKAYNEAYETRITNWIDANDGEVPKLVTIGCAQYFIDISVFAE